MAVAPIDITSDELPPTELEDIGDDASDEESLPDLDEWDKWSEEEDHLKTETLSELDSSELDLSEEEMPATKEESSLSWDEGITLSDDGPDEEVKLADEDSHITSEDLAWETPQTSTSDIREGMPFKEVAPPKVVEVDEPEINGAIDEASAVSHLFPRGRGETTEDFIDAVVGKPKKIGADISTSIVETPTCPECGTSISSDSFEYPEYVYETMGRARMEHGMDLLRDNEHEKAIEQFEIAKKLYEHAGSDKMVEEAVKRVDQGYDSMAEHHYVQGETLLKEGQHEWSIVQFKKARELYMFSTDAKKRTRCSQRVRDTYEEWGKSLEDEGDRLSKSGDTRSALAKYTEAAEKYREADAPKRLRGLDKKIRTA